MKPITLHPVSLLIGFTLAVVGMVVMGQAAPVQPQVLDVRELRVINEKGRLVARLGPNDDNSGALWLADHRGDKRASLEVFIVDPQSSEAGARLEMYDRAGKRSVSLEHSDYDQHGDYKGLRLGDVVIGSGGGSSAITLPGESGKIRVQNDWTGPSVTFEGSESSVFYELPRSVVYLGRENIEGFPPGSLVLRLIHGEGGVECYIDPQGEARLRLKDADGGEHVIGGD